MSLSSVIRQVVALDSTSTTGAGKTGLAFGDFTAKYLTEGGTLTSLTTETITTLGTYQAPTSSAHIRIKELNSADPTGGVYEVHFHDSQVALAGKRLWLFLSASGAVPVRYELDLSDVSGRLGTPAGASVSADLATIAAYIDTEVAAILAAVDTEVAAIKAKTDNLPSDPADASDIAASFSTVNGTLATIAAYIDTEVAAIKAKTDLIPAAPAATGDIPSAATVAAAVGGVTVTELATLPAASPTLLQAVALLYMGLRNKVEVTASAKKVHTDANTVLATKTLADDGSVYSETKMA